MKNLLLLISILLVLASCKTNEMWLNVVEPAPVTIPPYVKKVGVINRSMATDEAKPLDVADKVLSLEGKNLDRDGAVESIRGLTDELLANNRFTEVKTLNDIDFRTSPFAVFPLPLSWDIVAKVCSETGTDALFSLEKFDTDTRLGYSNSKRDVKTPLGVIPAIEHQSDMETLVKTGWRIYDPSSKAILDEFIYDESIVYHSRGINPVTAAAGLIGRKDAVKEVGNKAGHGYAMRLIPIETRVMRDYFVKGTNNFKIAKRKAQTGNWDAAGEIWKKETENPKMKVAGRAYYNMAIISEIHGDIEKAMEYARKSYEDYNNKLGIRYVRILENRRFENDVLEMQEQK
ncbi:MAG TPA: DUF6340 family protein [Bacteroidales bacterium]|jgi:tetratricopeptide (TPR) repeat protein|nr:DUF6340 family protein [Bacteroidales bacterium]